MHNKGDSNFRSQDYICKLENDEYAVTMIHTGAEQRDLIEKKIQIINEKLMSHEDEIPSITIFAGVAFGIKGIVVRTMNYVADEALGEGKKKSGGVCFKTAALS